MELHLILFLVLFGFSEHCSGQYFGELKCETDAKSTGCDLRKRCTVTCSSSCGSEGATPTIWGTRNYSDDSPVCRSAIHDYRISPGSSKSNVTFVRSAIDPKKYLSSIQQGIISTAFGSFSGNFFFISPYFTDEEILDVSTLNFMYLYERNGSFIQNCQINSKELKTIQFQFYIPSKNSTTKRIDLQKLSGSQEMTWTKPNLQPGGYWCNIVSNTYSDVMSIAMPSDADFLPDYWTVTASIQENVVIKFTPWQPITTPMNMTWRKDQQTLYSFPNVRVSQNLSGYYLEIDNVNVGDAGIYSLEFNNKIEKQGISRLIVRRCRKNHFGPRCDQECPDCQNGGVCHDIIGNCICPPGFNGTYCENRCPAGYFGQSCSQSCSSSRHAIDNSCKGALVCLPDPYGCSCAAGYKGLACNEETATPTTRITTMTTTSRPTAAPITSTTMTRITPSTTTTTTTRPSTTPTPTTSTTPTTPTTTSKPNTTPTTTIATSTIPTTTTTATPTSRASTTPPTTTATPTTPTTTLSTTPTTTTVTPTSPTTTTTARYTLWPITTSTTTIATPTTTLATTPTRPTSTTSTPTITPTITSATKIAVVTATSSTTRLIDPYTGTMTPSPTTSSTAPTITTTTDTTSTTATTRPVTAYTTTSTTSVRTDFPPCTTETFTLFPQERICQKVANSKTNFTVVLNPSNACQYGCMEASRNNVIAILKADGEPCKQGICVKGVCQETSEKTVCPEDFNGVRSICKEYCYSVQFPGMSILIYVRDGELCIDENNYHGTCMNGNCIVLQS